jgi:hypothetical protein
MHVNPERCNVTVCIQDREGGDPHINAWQGILVTPWTMPPQRFLSASISDTSDAIPQVCFGPESGCGWESIKKLPKFSRNAMFT